MRLSQTKNPTTFGPKNLMAFFQKSLMTFGQNPMTCFNFLRRTGQDSHGGLASASPVMVAFTKGIATRGGQYRTLEGLKMFDRGGSRVLCLARL